MESEDIILRQTTNYQLCQWDGEDRILRTDFNADNAKIDAAIADNAAAIAAEAEARAAGDFRVRLLDKTLQGGVTVDVDLSGIDFSPYLWVELYISCPASTGDFVIRFNGISSYQSGSASSGLGYNYTTAYAGLGARDSDGTASLSARIWTCPGGSLLHCVCEQVASGALNHLHTSCTTTLNQLQSLSMECENTVSNSIPAGSRILLYGVRR